MDEPPKPTFMERVRSWGLMVVCIAVGIAFLSAFLIAYLTHDEKNLTLLYGAIISQFGTVVNFFTGSSASSQKKDELIATMPSRSGPVP